MNKLLLRLLSLIAAVTLPIFASAQIEKMLSLDGYLEIIPAVYGNGEAKIAVVTYDQSETGVSSTYTIYDSDFNLIKTIKAPYNDVVYLEFNHSDSGVEISQTLFNNDDKFEYLICDDGVIKLMSEDGTVIQTLSESNATAYGKTNGLFVIDDKEYLTLDFSDVDYNFWQNVYRINRGNPSSIIEKVAEIPGMRTSRKGDILNVGFEPSSTDRTLNVVSANGMNVLSCNVAAGDSAANIDTRRFVSGVYVVTLQEPGKAAVETTKIIIR